METPCGSPASLERGSDIIPIATAIVAARTEAPATSRCPRWRTIFRPRRPAGWGVSGTKSTGKRPACPGQRTLSSRRRRRPRRTLSSSPISQRRSNGPRLDVKLAGQPSRSRAPDQKNQEPHQPTRKPPPRNPAALERTAPLRGFAAGDAEPRQNRRPRWGPVAPAQLVHDEVRGRGAAEERRRFRLVRLKRSEARVVAMAGDGPQPTRRCAGPPPRCRPKRHGPRGTNSAIEKRRLSNAWLRAISGRSRAAAPRLSPANPIEGQYPPPKTTCSSAFYPTPAPACPIAVGAPLIIIPFFFRGIRSVRSSPRPPMLRLSSVQLASGNALAASAA